MACRDCSVCTQPPSRLQLLLGPFYGLYRLCTWPLRIAGHLAWVLLVPPFLKSDDRAKRKCPHCGHNLDQHNLDQMGRQIHVHA